MKVKLRASEFFVPFTRDFVPYDWRMCLTDESVEDKLQRITSGYLAA